MIRSRLLPSDFYNWHAIKFLVLRCEPRPDSSPYEPLQLGQGEPYRERRATIFNFDVCITGIMVIA